MVKYLLNFLVIFIIFSSVSFAKNDEVKLQAEFGRDLKSVPFFLRYDYYKKFNKDWQTTDYLQRKVFLTGYEADLTANQNKADAEAKAAAQKEKARLRQEKQEELDQKLKDRQEALDERNARIADEGRLKAFNQSIKQEQQELKDMQRSTSQGAI